MDFGREAEEPGSGLRGFQRKAFGLFAEMPHRGSGTHYEARAARMLSRLAAESLEAQVELEPFAVDLSSGAWNVALHGTLLCLVLALDWLAGLGLAAAYGPGARAAGLGFLGSVPLPFAAVALGATLLLLASRISAGKLGWGVFSFFVPNADSADIVVSDLPRLSDGDSLRLAPAERWKRRFEASGKKRLLILAAHYDSARCLPPSKGKGAPPDCLLAALKNGIGLIPTAAYLLLALSFGLSVLLAFLDPSGALSRGAPGWIAAVLVLGSFGVAAVEAFIAGKSVNLPFQQGYNDDLSGVVAALGAFRGLAPRDAPRAEPAAAASAGAASAAPAPAATTLADTALMAVLTGSEENGLRGASEFARRVLAPAVGVFGKERVLLVNLDSVSGGELVAAAGERDFTGATKSGDPDFARKAVDFLRGPRLQAARAAESLAPKEIEASLEPAGPGAFAYRLRLEPEPLPACTDMTGFCSVGGLNRRLRAFTVVSREAGSGPLPQPRDYHQPSDTFETLFLESEPANFGNVLALSLALADLAAEADKGSFDGE